MFDFLRKYITLGTYHYMFTDGIAPLAIVSVTFYMTYKGRRKVTLDYDKDVFKTLSVFYHDIAPLNHSFYHTVVIPFLNKTKGFEDNNEAICLIDNFCNPKKVSTKDISIPSENKSDINNVIHYNFREDAND